MSAPVVLRLDSSSPLPAYRQIVDGLRLLLVAGTLEAGSTLPTVRALALDLGVHFSTVAEAYRTLSAEGWVELRRRNGAVVVDRKNPAARPETRAEFSTRLRQLIAQMRSEGLSIKAISKELALVAQELQA